jgi:inner membrane protein
VHVQTHILSGWCVGNLLPINARQRLFCMIAASIADIDGLGILFSQELYWDYHHKFGHCAIFGVIVCAALAAFSQKRLFSFAIYLALFHLHLLLDVLGSGTGWAIYYFWPISSYGINISWGWELYSWQNITTFALLLIWTIWIAIRFRRTPLEAIMPNLDRQLTNLLAKSNSKL